ncbi:hypothetical protein KCU92_g131, partial [Aureobasidium melanogenum]|jgi:hypothetical protein
MDRFGTRARDTKLLYLYQDLSAQVEGVKQERKGSLFIQRALSKWVESHGRGRWSLLDASAIYQESNTASGLSRISWLKEFRSSGQGRTDRPNPPAPLACALEA